MIRYKFPLSGDAMAPATSPTRDFSRLTKAVISKQPATFAVLSPVTTVSKCPAGEEWDKIEQRCRKTALQTRFSAAKATTTMVAAEPQVDPKVAPLPPPAPTATDPKVEPLPEPPAPTTPVEEALPPPPPPSYGGGGGGAAYNPGVEEAPPDFVLTTPELELPVVATEAAATEKTHTNTILLVGGGLLIAYLVLKK